MRYIFFIIFFLIILRPQLLYAIYDPLSVPNNKYGIHIADAGDIRDAASLVNSTGGDWGYVTVVIAENDRNIGRWQEHFNLMRRLHLIPIVRIATHTEGLNWVTPQKVDADKWADFLNSLNWPIKNRYVVLFNEPNHAKEWGGVLDPEGYADTTMAYLEALKSRSDDFFVLPAGFDFSARTDNASLDAVRYVERMYQKNPDYFKRFDGWTSHSYPNPGFSGPPQAFGRGTIAGFVYELQFLRSLGISKQYPVFITETGWQHSQGKILNINQATPPQIGQNMKIASQGIWQNPSIAAITPFILNYQDIPFDHFSFKEFRSDKFYPHFDVYQSIPKQAGKPMQYEQYLQESPLLPDTLVINSTYTLQTTIINKGQAIVDPTHYALTLETENNAITGITEPLSYMEPNERCMATIHLKTPDEEGTVSVKIFITHDNTKTLVEEKTVTLVPPPNITITVPIGLKKIATLRDVTVLVYDTSDTLIHKFPNITIINNQVMITGLYNMVPGSIYRIVILAPYYLPRQAMVLVNKESTSVTYKRLLPLDIDNDGALTIKDITSLIFTRPRDVIGRW